MPKYLPCSECSGKGETVLSGMTITCPKCKGFRQVMAEKVSPAVTAHQNLPHVVVDPNWAKTVLQAYADQKPLALPRVIPEGIFKPNPQPISVTWPIAPLPEQEIKVTYTVHYDDPEPEVPAWHKDFQAFLERQEHPFTTAQAAALKAFYGLPLTVAEASFWDTLYDDTRSNYPFDELPKDFHTLLLTTGRQTGKSTMVWKMLEWELENMLKRDVRKEFGLVKGHCLNFFVVTSLPRDLLKDFASRFLFYGGSPLSECWESRNESTIYFRSKHDPGGSASVRLTLLSTAANPNACSLILDMEPWWMCVFDEFFHSKYVAFRKTRSKAARPLGKGLRPRMLVTGTFQEERAQDVPPDFDRAFETGILETDPLWKDSGILVASLNTSEGICSEESIRAMHRFSSTEPYGLRWEDRVKRRIRDATPNHVIDALQDEGLDSETISRILVRISNLCN